MALQLPVPFEAKMKSLLGDQYEAFKETYEQHPQAGIRINTLKVTPEDFRKISPFELEPIPWCPTGYYVPDGTRPGRHPYYHAGLYYIQEPSAMAPVELLQVEPGDRVLDLCAAPGGKSTQIAAKLSGRGVLVSNDLHPDRTKALAKNLEMYGVRNAVVLNDHPDRIAAAFPAYFNKILIDAPCSGEGMFRKDEDMLKYWQEDSPMKYAGMQKEILQAAAAMLCKGGTIVYSTCTFSPEENEGMIALFLKEHPDFVLVPIGESDWFSPGEADWLSRNGLPGLDLDAELDADLIRQTSGTGRLWPHRIQGEGHFMAVLRRIEGPETPEGLFEEEESPLNIAPSVNGKKSERKLSAGKGRSDRLNGKRGKQMEHSRPARGAGAGLAETSEAIRLLREFIETQLRLDISSGHLIVQGHNIYVSPLPEIRLKNVKTVRPGWYMGQVKNGRFVPGHPLAAALHPEEAGKRVHLSSANGEAVRYLKGETLQITEDRIEGDSNPKGYVLVCIDGYAAGWAKWQPGMLKNEYPAGWRWTSV